MERVEAEVLWPEVCEMLSWVVNILAVSQSAIAEQIGRSQPTISRWLNSIKTAPPPDDIIKLKSILQSYVDRYASRWSYVCSKAAHYSDQRDRVANSALANTFISLKAHPDDFNLAIRDRSVMLNIVALSANLAPDAEAYIFVNNPQSPKSFIILIEKSLAGDSRVNALEAEFVGHVLPIILGKQRKSEGRTVPGWHLWRN